MAWKMNRKRYGLCATAWLCLLCVCAISGFGQVMLSENELEGQVVEPSGGAAQVVFRFSIQDRDPLANDASGIQVQCLLIQNLGTATELDIPFVILQGPQIQTPSAVAIPTMAPPVGAPPANCPPGAGAGGNVSFEAFIDKTQLDQMGFGGDPNDVADDGSLIVEVAVQVANTATLLSGSQNHTLKLRVSLQFQETVGSPPLLTTFSDSITDPHQDRVSNSGINTVRSVNFLNNTIRIGQPGLVGRFEVCDKDANTLDLSLDTVRVVQGDQGDALHSDIEYLTVSGGGYSNGIPPTANFNQGGIGENLHIHALLPDDECMVFDVTVTISAAAQRGRKIQLKISLFASEPSALHPSVAPYLEIRQSVLIGSGILRIPDSFVAGSSVPINLEDFPLPGLGRLEVQTQPMQFDPSVISVEGMDAQPPYVLQDFNADNRAGLLRFTLKLDPTQTSSAKTQGTIALIHVSRRGQAGQSTLLLFKVDRVLDADNVNVTPGVVVVSGFITLLAPGDVDFDGVPTVRDALIVANAILPCTTNPDSPIPDLTDEQKKSADVAPVQANVGETPGCIELNSADVREIARLAITVGISGERVFDVAPAGRTPQRTRPWWQHWLDLLFQPQQARPAAQARLLPVGAGAWQVQVQSDQPVAAIQGILRFDPRSGEADRVEAAAGYHLMAYRLDVGKGELRFVALATGAPRPEGAVLEVHWRDQAGASPRLEIEHLLNPQALELPVVVTSLGERSASLQVDGLRVQGWNGGYGVLEVVGQGVARTAIEGFDLSGRRRFKSEAVGSRLSWSMLDSSGRSLANGVYLYVVTVHGTSGQVWRSQVHKLVWLR